MVCMRVSACRPLSGAHEPRPAAQKAPLYQWTWRFRTTKVTANQTDGRATPACRRWACRTAKHGCGGQAYRQEVRSPELEPELEPEPEPEPEPALLLLRQLRVPNELAVKTTTERR